MKRKLQRLLINAETAGIHHKVLMDKVRTPSVSIDDIKAVLEQWRTEGRVQKFLVKLPTSKRPITVWRATRLLETVRV